MNGFQAKRNLNQVIDKICKDNSTIGETTKQNQKKKNEDQERKRPKENFNRNENKNTYLLNNSK